MARNKATPREEELYGVTTYNSMLCIDGKTRKRWCVGCGGPRDPEYAERVPCGCCGALGTRKTQPQFDEDGDAIPETERAEATETPKRERKPRQAAPKQRDAADAVVENFPTSDAAKAIRLSRQTVRPVAVLTDVPDQPGVMAARPAVVASLADFFL